MKKGLVVLSKTVFFLMVLSTVSTAHAASTAAVSFTGGSTTGTDFPASWPGVTDGWQFSVGSAITVTHLGFYDFGSNGLNQSHEVGIFMEAGTLLFSDMVTTTDVLDVDSFRYTSITPTVLSAGTYRIGSFRSDTTDNVLMSVTGLTSTAPVSYLTGYTKGDVGSLTFPDFHPDGSLQPASFGPNFKFDTQVIPVPSAFLLGSLGLGLIGWIRRCRGL